MAAFLWMLMKVTTFIHQNKTLLQITKAIQKRMAFVIYVLSCITTIKLSLRRTLVQHSTMQQLQHG